MQKEKQYIISVEILNECLSKLAELISQTEHNHITMIVAGDYAVAEFCPWKTYVVDSINVIPVNFKLNDIKHEIQEVAEIYSISPDWLSDKWLESFAQREVIEYLVEKTMDDALTETADAKHKVAYDVYTYFGIVERPRQSVHLTKKAKEVQISEFTQEQLDSPLKEGVENIEQEVENGGSKSLEAIIAELHRLVWFKIIEHSGKYYIAMFYDNEYNHADGEDL